MVLEPVPASVFANCCSCRSRSLNACVSSGNMMEDKKGLRDGLLWCELEV